MKRKAGDGTPRTKQSNAHTAGAVSRRSFLSYHSLKTKRKEEKRGTQDRRQQCNYAFNFYFYFISSSFSISFYRFLYLSSFSSAPIGCFLFVYFDSECTSCATYSPIDGPAVNPELSIPTIFLKIANPLLTSYSLISYHFPFIFLHLFISTLNAQAAPHTRQQPDSPSTPGFQSQPN